MATKRITIELDEELFDTASALAEAAAETTLNVYIIEAIGYVNNMRCGLPETKVRVQEWGIHKNNVAARVIEKCMRQQAYENDKRGSES